MKFKQFLKTVYYHGCAALLGVLMAANVFAYKAVYRGLTTESVFLDSRTNILEIVKEAEGDTLEDKIKDVIDESINFKKEDVSPEFVGRVFDFLDEKKIDVKGKKLTLEEKMLYAQMFSSTLKYNAKANWISNVAYGKDVSAEKTIESVYEFSKISNMSHEEIMGYGTVVCGQFAKVYAAALHIINDSSANPDDIHVATLAYAPNEKPDYGERLNVLLSVINVIAFGEYRSSISHVINLVATEDKFYLVEPQWKLSKKVYFNSEYLDINKDYAGKFKAKDS